ncbi:hypothetical protein [Faecalibacillus faecis]|uniref:hypothetical protein n=1 Tax=Faecalibacillus faecis TaxID=1982628 RepID=UPI00386BC73B
MFWIREDTLEHVVEIDKYGVIKEYYDGYIIKDGENDGKIIIEFKDINYKQEIMNRYFVIQEEDITEIKNIYNKYKNNKASAYQYMEYLRDMQDKDVYQNNKSFFVSQNISEKEWNDFCA